MKKGFLLAFLLLSSQLIFAQNEIGPEGHKIVWGLVVIVAILVAFVVAAKPFKKRAKKASEPLFKNRKVSVALVKDKLYYPDKLTLTVKNEGNTDIDLDKPLLELDNFWLKRKFKLKGTGNRNFYPLFLEKGKTHSLQIDLNGFYEHDKSLKKFPKAKVVLSDVKGKKLGSKSVFLRKTLFKF